MKRDRCVYVIYNTDKMIAYVGLTKDFTSRIRNHRNKKKTLFDGNYSVLNLTGMIEQSKAQAFEKDCIGLYRSLGFHMLNKMDGGGIGGGIAMWTLERCYLEALQYPTHKKFRQGSWSVYIIAKRNGWLEPITRHMLRDRKPNGYWTKELCHAIALTCTKRSTFNNTHQSVAAIAQRQGWYREITSHMSDNRFRKHETA